MSFLERAKQAAEQARQVGLDVAGQASAAVKETGEKAQATLRDPATAEKARQSLRFAKRGLATAVERIDPSILADVIIKATVLQERANAALKAKGSPYRIAEIAIGASIPPSVQFSIARTDDPELLDAVQATSAETLAAASTGPAAGDSQAVVTLDGASLDEADLSELA